MTRINQIARTGICCLLLIIASGCAAIGARTNYGPGRPYAGVRDDAPLPGPSSEADIPGLQPLNLIDLPLSFVVDTLLLPFDLTGAK